MPQSAGQYWRMIWAEAWKAAWGAARSWSALALVALGVAGLYFAGLNSWRVQLSWEIPLGLTTILLVIFIPLTIYRTNKKLEMKVAEDLVGKWFHTIGEKGEIRNQGKVLNVQSGRYLIQLYSFFDGDPTTQRFMTPEELATAHFYESHQAMSDEYERRFPPKF